VIEHDLAAERVPLEAIQQHPDNAHLGDVDAIAASIAKNGQYTPILVQSSSGHIIKGNHTYQAMMQLGLADAWVVYLDVDDERAKRIMVADNRTSALGREDEGLLLALLDELKDSDEGLEGLGYTPDDYLTMEAEAYLPLDLGAAKIEDVMDIDDTGPESLFVVVPVVDDVTGECTEFSIYKRSGRHMTSSDMNRLIKALGGRPLTREELAEQGVPKWM
jgi:hypothetical protein